MSSNRELPPGPGWVASRGHLFWCTDRIAWNEHYRKGEEDKAKSFIGRPPRRKEPEEPQPRARESPAREARESQAHAEVQLLEQRLHYLRVEFDAVSRLLAQARKGPVFQ